MRNQKHRSNQKIARVVEQRAGVGASEIVSGWQAMLVDLLSRMKSFLSPGVTVFSRSMPAIDELKAVRHVSIDVIAPSLTDTNLAEALLSDDGKRAAAAERHPLWRIGPPADITAMARFLLSGIQLRGLPARWLPWMAVWGRFGHSNSIYPAVFDG